MALKIIHYFDYKSPYAYLAQTPTDQLETKFNCRITRLPYTLNIPTFLGAAELDESGVDILGTRSEHHWRRVRYSYMDCRREANRRGLTIRGPRKIWESSLAHIGFLFASDHGNFAAYHAAVYERFWRRELDIENINVVITTLADAGIDTAGFAAFANGAGRVRLESIHRNAETKGVFGVPSWTVNGELFWGSERLGLIEESISRAQQSARALPSGIATSDAATKPDCA